MKTINTLLEDIDAIFSNPEHKVSDENLSKFTDGLTKIIKEALEKSGKVREDMLRMSNLGTADRKLYLDIKTPSPANTQSPALEQRFLLGHVVEQLLIFLIREAGHKVAHEQLEVIVDGVVGHLDFTIDDVVTDSKSCSAYQFFKFQSAYSLKNNDTFGYLTQLAGYREAMKDKEGIDKEKAAILAMNKSDSQKRLLIFDEMELPDIPSRIKHVKEMLDSPIIPPICHQPVLDPKSGNSELAKGCGYCRHKFGCFPTLRVFDYANGPKYLTSVITTPRVPEIKRDQEEVIEEELQATFED